MAETEQKSPATEACASVGEITLAEITARNIAALRTGRKMTQLELGEALSYSDKAVSKWERGVSVPDAYVLLALSRLFEVSVDWLLTLHDELPPPPARDLSRRRAAITSLSFFGILTAATIAFVVLAILGHPLWELFVYALPAAIADLVVFNSLWGNARRNFVLVALLLPAIVLSAFVALLPVVRWQLFLLLAPAELCVLISSFLLKRK